MEPHEPTEPTEAEDRVRVGATGHELDAIVFDRPSRSKVVVAVVDPARGPAFRTVHEDALTERSEDGPDDHALRALIRRTAPPVRGSARGGGSTGRGMPGHSRAAMHRTTGK